MNYASVSDSDLLLVKHYKELFYLAPKELAMAINSMPAAKLFQLILTIQKGEGMNVELIMEKLDELGKYQNLDGIFMQAWFLLILKDFIECDPDINIDKETFCRAHKEIKKIWSDENEPNKKEKADIFLNNRANIEPPEIIKEFIDAGQLDKTPINGKFKIYKQSMRNFIFWCFDQGYGEHISTRFILQNISYRGSSSLTIDKYITQARAAQKLE